MESNYLSINNLGFVYERGKKTYEVIKNLNFSIDKNDFVSIVGGSGCGKTTLLNLISGVLRPTEGSIFNYNNHIDRNKVKISYMFQKDNLLPWYTVKQNIEMYLRLCKSYNEESLINTERMLEKYNLLEYKNFYPKDLSGGMYQRVALINILVQKPQLMLLDEPLASLDYEIKTKFYDDFFNIIKNEGTTAIMVTHNFEEAVMCSDKVIVLNRRPCSVKKIVQIKFKGLTPIERRKRSEFIEYVDEIMQKE